MAAVIWPNAQLRRSDKLSKLSVMDMSDLPARLRRASLSQASLARFLGLDPSSLTKTITGKRRLKADEMLRIEQFFREQGGVEGENIVALGAARRTGPRRIPVYGYAVAGGDDQVAINPGQVIDWIDTPPIVQATNADLIAIRVVGESMEPRYFAGEIVIAQVGLPPAKGRDCVIEMLDGSGLLKTYSGMRDGHVFAHQFNPARELPIPATSVKALHSVICRL
jgi:phage repressor protein C with HTH and peptisase S24 domain